MPRARREIVRLREILERAMERGIEKGSRCWIWKGPQSRTGYGKVMITISAHRLAYLLKYDSIEPGLVLDHLCRNRTCVNPAHMEAVTAKTNVRRGHGLASINAAKKACPQGHPYNEENTCFSGGRRYCLACVRPKALARYHRRKAANA